MPLNSKKYVLDEHHNIHVADLEKWGKWMETHSNKVIKQEAIDSRTKISTVFLGLDHNFDGGEPLLFETMIFGGPHDQECWRCSTWDEAVAQHERVKETVK